MNEISNSIGSAQNVNYIGGDSQHNNMTIQEIASPSTPEYKTQLNEAITQLQKAVNEDEKLTQEQKQKILEKLKILEDAVLEPQKENQQQRAKKVVDSLETTIDMLSPATKFIEACHKLFPLITKVFGL